MEDIFYKLVKEASHQKHPALRQACCEAQEVLGNKHSLLRNPPYEIRQKCFDALQLALESKDKKLISLSLSGMQQLLREQLFNPNFESDDEELWLPSQLMRAVSSLNSHSEEVQVEGLKVLMQCTCLQNWCLSQNTVLAIAKLCLDIYGSSSAAAKTAAITTASQTVQAYVCFLFDSSVEDARDDEEQRSLDEGCDTNNEGHISPFDEIVPLLSFFCEKLKEEKRGVSSSTTTLLLQCIQTALSSLKGQAKQSQQFLDFVWQQLCPRLVGCLGSPLKDKNIVSAQRFEKGEMGRGSGCLATAPSCQGEEAKLVYGIAVELVKVVGAVGALRPVLGSLFHRMLLYPLPQHCLEPLKFVKEMLKNPEQLLQFAGPPLWEDTKNPRLSDLDLLKIVVDGLGECCHSNDPNVCYVSVECVVALLASLETLVSGARISEEMAERINTTYPTLQSADYVGASFLLEKSARVGFTNGWQPSSTEKGTFPVSSHTLLSNLERVILERHKDNCLPRDESPPRSSPVERALEACEEFDMESLDSVPRASNEKEMDIEASGKEEEELDGDVDKENTGPERPGECPEHPENLGDTLDPGGTEATEADANAVEKPSEGNDPIQPDEEEFVQSRNDEDLDTAESLDAEMSEKDFVEEPDNMHVVHEKASEPLMKDANRSERERLERFFESNDKFAERERKTAREFVGRLSEFLPRLLHIRSSIEADQDLQQFASDYSEALWQQQQQHSGPSGSEDGPHHITIVNADGIYLATYSALLLDLKLLHSGYYQGLSTDVPLTEEKFIEEVHGSGVLVYLSATWLSELYQQVLLRSLLEGAGYEPDSRTNHSLINLLTDMDGLESDQLGSRQLSDYRRLERASVNVELTPSMLAGMKFARRVLTTCWDTMLEVLCVLLNGTNSCGVASSLGLLLGTDGAKEDRRKAREAVADCLDGLQRAAKLYNVLGLQTKCGAIFAQLAAASCPSLGSSAAASSEMRRTASKRDRLRNTVLPGRSKAVRLHSSHVLSMDVLLSRGLELGSHSAVCWPHVFRCCCYILELERSCFQGKSSAASQLKLQFSPFSRCDKKQSAASPKPSSDSLVLQPPTECYEDEAMLEPAPMPGSVSVQSMSVADMVKSSTQAAGTCVLSGKQLEPIVEALSQLVDRLFDEAAGKLNLCALVGFLSELCAASRAQLFSKGQQQHQQPNQGGGAQHPLLLLNRLSEVMLRCARGGRPLVHIMKAWSIVAPHFVEVACHKDQVIAKRAVASIHDIVGALLSAHIDLPHFHFNEALFKPFENILCLELCDVDIQEQIVSSICEFVEGSTAEIRSGWRPLFGALRAVRMPCSATACCPQRSLGGSEREQLERTHHLRVVLDVFDAFLGTDNPGVFANAAVDCLLCLLKHVRGPTELQDLGEGEATIAQELDAIPLNLCQAALKYLERCAQMLSSMYLMPACPVFHSAIRIKFNLEPNCVDPVIPDMELILFREHDSVSEHSRKGSMTDEGDDKVWYVQNDMDEDIELLPTNHTVSLEELDRPTGVLHVWFLLLEGLAGAVATCPRKYQPHTIDTLFQMLRGLWDVPGPEFGVYAVNHLLLPMLQGWLRRAAKTHRGWDGFATNFKQCCGLATELVVDYLTQLSASGTMCQVRGLHLMVHQLFLVLTECIAQPAEVISRLGCACIRHLLVSSAPSLSPELWRIATWSVARASRATLRSAQQLMVCFHADSENFYGDVGQAKVAVRRDCGPLEADRLRQLCRQVFLLDAQRAGPTSGRVRDVPPGVDDQCSFIFLLHPPNRLGDGASGDPDACVIRVPFRSLVVGLLSHQILLQTLATLLLEGTAFRLPALASVLGCPPSPRGPPGAGAERRGSADAPQLAGQLGRLPEEDLLRLLDVLGESHTTATDFDERPGLKFLVQKVAQAEVAANLFKQAAISWAVQAVVLLELCLRKTPPEPLSMHLVDRLVASHRDGGEQPPARPRRGRAEDASHEEDKGPSVSEPFPDSDRCTPVPDRASTSSSCFASDADDSANSPARAPRRTSNLSERRRRRRRQHARRGSDSFGVVEHTVSREGPDSQEGGRTLNWNPFGRLRQLFQELCVHYARVASPEAKGSAIVDQVGDQPIFYLMAQPDTLPEILPHGHGDRREGVVGGSPSGRRPSSTDSDSSSEPAADPPSEEGALEPDRVYTVVTEKTIQSMVSEYKRRKTRHSMPPASAAAAAVHRSRAAVMRSRSVPAGNDDGASSVGSPPPASSPPPQSTAPPLPKEVENQRKCSILKDAEAHVQVWSQLAQSVLELHLSLKEPEFLALVPVFYAGVEALIGAAPSEPELRVLAADWLHRVALGLGFSGDSAVAARRC